jgi:hypothetical protein
MKNILELDEYTHVPMWVISAITDDPMSGGLSSDGKGGWRGNPPIHRVAVHTWMGNIFHSRRPTEELLSELNEWRGYASD